MFRFSISLFFLIFLLNDIEGILTVGNQSYSSVQAQFFKSLKKTPKSSMLMPFRCKGHVNDDFSECQFPFSLSSNFLIVDFGLSISGRIQLDMTSTSEHESQMSIGFCESGENLDPRGDATSQHPINIPEYYPSIIKIPQFAKKLTAHSKFSGAFRYIYITVDKSQVEISEIKALIEIATNIPLDEPYPGNLACSDEDLNEIWYSSVYTQELAISKSKNGTRFFIDGGKRDRAIWSADAFVQMMVSLVSLGDHDGIKNTLEELGRGQEKNGYIPHMMTIDGEEDRIALRFAKALEFTEYQCWFIIGVTEYFWYSGDYKWARKMEPILDKGMLWLRKKSYGNGLLNVGYGIGGFFGDGSNWHTPDATTGIVTHLNCLVVWSISEYLKFKTGLGKEMSNEWDIWRRKMIQEINSKLWDDDKGFYRNSNPLFLQFLHPQIDVHDANVIALLSQVADKPKVQRILSYIEKNLTNKYGVLSTNQEIKWPSSLYMFPFMSRYISPYYNFLEMFARLESDYCNVKCIEKVIEMTKKTWGRMLEKAKNGGATTFWEKMSETGDIEAYRQMKMPVSFTSLCHGWSSGPAWSLMRALLGIKVVDFGYKKIIINPHVGINNITWAEGWIPTPYGLVQVNWRIDQNNMKKWHLSVIIPEGISGEVYLPDGNVETLTTGGIFNWDAPRNIFSQEEK